MRAMPDDPADACPPPDAENNTPEAPAPRAAHLQHDKPDIGCLLALVGLFILVFLAPALALLGGAPLILPLILCFLLVLATPWLNPAEKKEKRLKWTGRVLTFLLMAGLVVLAWVLLSGRFGDRFTGDDPGGEMP